ncbi:MAG: sulfite exporter TauE/SafE family protein [Geminicoccaceae bacterium]
MNELAELVLTPAFALAALGTGLAGIVRGFSGFGTALILIPTLSLAFDPKIAVPTMALLDAVATLPILPRAFRHCAWREVLILTVSWATLLPAGLVILLWADQDLLTRVIGMLVLTAALVMALGVRYQGRPSRTATLTTGGLSGLLSGAVGIGGPPVVILWLSGPDPAAMVRANIFAFFGATSFLSPIGHATAGLLTGEVLWLIITLLPIYGLALWLGAATFGRTSEVLFRRVALGVIAAVGIAALGFA